jgi:alpha-glucosidase
MTWLPVADGGVLAFDRVPAVPGDSGAAGAAGAAGAHVAPDAGADGVRCVANLSAGPVELPPHAAVLLTSGPLRGDGLLPPDTTAWLSV